MMAVRDRDKGNKWICINGTCTKNPLGTYNSKAECEANVTNNFIGGQCSASYHVYTNGTYNGIPSDFYVSNDNNGDVELIIIGPIKFLQIITITITPPFGGQPYDVWGLVYQDGSKAVFFNKQFEIAEISKSSVGGLNLVRIDGNPDNCGNPDRYCGLRFGCTDPAANNYDSTALFNDGSCTYDILGCTDPSANNYNPAATIDDGSCTYDVYGCTDSGATNYNPDATIDDGSCTY